ncbi:MAG TPA: serine/threonine-protein kinase [Candidatus Polarisedimenticolia bacterium]|nr:serine/threonine-protein kinase [Candidatus Polarisedimenticolia bacterium]
MKLGRFEVLREIGKGAMGVVYLAHDPRIDRKIAIKMIQIPPGVSEEEAREARHRFVREAQAAGKLAHPNIITIYDVVEDPQRTYIAMEYIDGVTLETFTKPGSLLPLATVLSVITQACSALDYAHKSQVIHRDIKPANLMLMKGDLLKVTDFGLAKKPDANLTQAGVLIGTPNYMSPEQISGKPMDGRSDFFSLGVVLYELLTGERPFGGDTISTIIYRILYDEPRPPRIVNEKLPPAFDQILKRALAKEPADRFQSGAEFAEALSNYSTYHFKRPVSTAAPTLRVGREESGPTVLRPRDRSRAYPRSVPAPSFPLFAGQPLKIAACVLLAMVGLVLFPRRVHEIDQSELRAARSPEARVEAAQAGFSTPFGAPAVPQAKLPSSGREARIQVAEGTELFLDGELLSKPLLRLSESDEKEHQLLAVQGCRQRSTLVTLRDFKDDYDLRSLEPAQGTVNIATDPPNATVILDGKPAGKTPTAVPIETCEKHSLRLVLKDYREKRFEFAEDAPLSKISADLGFDHKKNKQLSIALEKIPMGVARLEPPPPFPMEATFVSAEGKSMSPDIKNGELSLPEGKLQLQLVNEKVRFKRSIEVEIVGGETRSVRVEWPSLGKLSVQAEPSNCKVYVDGIFLDNPPVFEHPLVAGEHEILVVPETDHDQKQARKITIESGLTRLEKFTF